MAFGILKKLVRSAGVLAATAVYGLVPPVETEFTDEQAKPGLDQQAVIGSDGQATAYVEKASPVFGSVNRPTYAGTVRNGRRVAQDGSFPGRPWGHEPAEPANTARAQPTSWTRQNDHDGYWYCCCNGQKKETSKYRFDAERLCKDWGCDSTPVRSNVAC